ncbi:MAG TPA: hypothetical protein VH853_05245 [Polyangia bacterium]|nr:hypothetical protein [Polyangia bacterium]
MNASPTVAGRSIGLLALAGVCLAGACAHVSDDIAIMDAGDGVIYRIDNQRLPKPETGSLEIKPGGHEFDVTAKASEWQVVQTVIHKSGLRTVCLKARGGHRYQLKAVFKDDELKVFIIDKATGEPPKTPCGPDEDEN